MQLNNAVNHPLHCIVTGTCGSLLCLLLSLSLSVKAQPLLHRSDWLQQSVNSCALAALSYALNRGHGVVSHEGELVRRAAAFYPGSGGLPPEHGYSIGDVRRLSTALGVRADPWRLALAAIDQQPLPALLWMEESGRSHVVVLLAVTSRAVHLFDPAVGHYWLSRDRLADRWMGDRTSGLLIALTSASARDALD